MIEHVYSEYIHCGFFYQNLDILMQFPYLK